jgi:hypothetical protein
MSISSRATTCTTTALGGSGIFRRMLLHVADPDKMLDLVEEVSVIALAEDHG